MSQNVKLKPISTIIADLGLEDGGRVHKEFAQACAIHMDKYVPMQRGNLAKYKLVDNGTSIMYDQPYAHYMYVGKVMGPNIPIKVNGIVVRWFSRKPKHYTGADIDYKKNRHEYAGAYWDKRMWSAEKNEIVSEMQNYIERGGK